MLGLLSQRRPGHFCHILQPRNCLACAPSVTNGTVKDALKVMTCDVEVKQQKRTYMLLVAFIMQCVSNAVSSDSGC